MTRWPRWQAVSILTPVSPSPPSYWWAAIVAIGVTAVVGVLVIL